MKLYLAGGLAAIVLSAGGAAAQEGADLHGLDSLLSRPVSAAARYEQTAAESPASVTIITAEEIATFGWRTLEELIGAVPGFYTSNDRNYAYLGVRGVGRPADYNNRILLLLDGVPINEGFYGSMSAGTELGVDLRTLQRVEIVRGPGSALYGSSAMLAVVNLVPDRAAGTHTRVTAGTNELYGAAARFATRQDRLRVGVSGEYQQTNGEDLSFPELGITAHGMDRNEAANAGAWLSWRDLEVSVRTSSRTKWIPTGAWETDFGDPRTRTIDAMTDAIVEWQPRLDASRQAHLRASFHTYDYEGWYPMDGIMYQDANVVRRWQVDGQLTWDIRADNRLVMGGGMNAYPRASYRSWGDGWEWYGDYPYETWDLYIQDEWHVTPRLVLVSGLRFDHGGLGFGRLTPRAAAVWSSESLGTIKALYGEAFRAPTLYEAYYEDPLVDWIASEDLRPETARTAEVSWDRRFGAAVHAGVAAFRTRVSGLIDLAEDPDGTTQFANVEDAVSHGVEGQLQVRAATGVFARFSYAWARTLFDEETATNSPEHILRSAIAVPLPGAIRLATEARWESGRLTLQDDRTDPAFLLDATMRWAPGGRFAASVSGRNLLDANFRIPGGYEHAQATLPQQGRTLRLGLEYRMP